MINLLKDPWPWYLAGPLIGLTIPALLILGNKTFGISSSLRHICAACVPANVNFFKYNWKKESWNLSFVIGIFLGGMIVSLFLTPENYKMVINKQTMQDLQNLGISDFSGLMPLEIFGTDKILSINGFWVLAFGGFMVGFGTRYAGGCTSGHSIMGISNLQLPSLIATIFFMAGGFLSTHFILPLILNF